MGKLYDFQEQGVNFLLSNLPKSGANHRLLADEMGLGKSVQACVAMKRANVKYVLIICLASIKQTWAKYILDWTDFSHTDIQILNTGADSVTSAKVLIVNYELLLNKNIRKQLQDCYFDLVIVDECQRLKTLSSKTSQIVLSQMGRRPPLISRGRRKWLLSGTVMPNRPLELYPALRTLAPEVINPYLTYDDYGMYFCNGFEEAYGGMNYRGAINIPELSARLQPFMLRREIKDVYKELPNMIYEPIYCDIGDMAQSLADTPMATLRKLVGEAKVPFVVSFLKDKLEDTGEKIVAFCYTRSVIESIADADDLAAFNPVYIYGGMSQKEKDFALKYFAENINCRLLILQITAAGTGVDGIQLHSRIIVFPELEWSAGTFDQAIGRLYRIGQENNVIIYPIIATNTLDDNIMTSYYGKKQVIKKLHNSIDLSIRLIEGKCGNINCLGTKKTGSCKCKELDMSLEQSLERIAGALEKLSLTVPLSAVAAAKEAIALPDTQAGAKKGRPPGSPNKATTAKTEVTKEVKANQDGLRQAALKVIRGCPEGEEEGKAHVSRVVKSLDYQKLKDIPDDECGEAIAALERVLGTFVPDAEESDDLD